MSIKENYTMKRVTFGMQDGLEEKIDRLTVMMSKLMAKDDGQINSSSLRCFKAKEEDKQEIVMTNVTTIREIIKIGIDQVVAIEEFQLVVEFGMDKITEVA